MKKIVIGILAHVDAGKTTLAEGMLYTTGSIRKLGRVDHKDAFLDTFELERARGITIFSKQAELNLKETNVTLLDTPGHVDFSAEMERTLQVLDYAILVISGSDGVQGHTETLWRLLASYKIPTFLFVNKMDLVGADHTELMKELKKRLSDGCVDFGKDQDMDLWSENIALCDESLLEKYMESQVIEQEDVIDLIAERKMFPCYFGSALKLEGVEEFLTGIDQYLRYPNYSERFGAKVFKIVRDDQGNRLTYMKVTGGSLRVKMLLTNQKSKDKIQTQDVVSQNTQGNLVQAEEEGQIWEEKIDQIRIYSGVKYETTEEVFAGAVCAVTGLSKTYPGEGLGIEALSIAPLLEPVLSFQIMLPQGCDVHGMLLKLRLLEEEDPQLHIVWNEQLKEIHVQLMGEVQIEVLKRLILDRFGVSVEFSPGNIVYKETIQNPVIGVGHFEPLRHYAEVHLLMEPGEPGSGLIFDTSCPEDDLERSWQRLVLTHLEEKEYIGVLIGAPITDMKITLVAGRAHLKHTEGGDFRQATYRAVRQGLMQAQSVILEPYYNFRIEVPSDTIGRAMADVQRMSGNFTPPEIDGDMSILMGSAPVATMRGYQTEVTSYTKGRGRLFCTLRGYEPCHNLEEVIAAIGYDSERDLANPSSSVFCAHGAGFVVEWDKVNHYQHIESGVMLQDQEWIEDNEDQLEKQSWTADLGKRNDQGQQDAPKRVQVLQRIQVQPKGQVQTYGQVQRNGQVQPNDQVQRNGQVQSNDQVQSSVPGQPRIQVEQVGKKTSSKTSCASDSSWQADKELEAIFTRTFGPIKQKLNTQSSLGYEKKPPMRKNLEVRPLADRKEKEKEPVKEYLLVDGYNIIFAWEELNSLAKDNLEAARNKLMDILCNYQGFKKCIVILVFDAYKVKGNLGEVIEYHNIHVVYTKEAETADMYIEKVTHDLGRKHRVTVATSDGLEQIIIMGQGASRLSANDLKEEVTRVNEQIRKDYLEAQPKGRNFLGSQFSDEIKEYYQEDKANN